MMKFSKKILVVGISILVLILLFAVVTAVLVIPDIIENDNQNPDDELSAPEITDIRIDLQEPGFNEIVTITATIKNNWRIEGENKDDPGKTEIMGGGIYYAIIGSGGGVGSGNRPMTLVSGDTFSTTLEPYFIDFVILFFISAQTKPVLEDPDDPESYTYEEVRSDWMTIATKDTELVENGIVFNEIVEEINIPDERYVKFSFNISEPQNIKEVYFEHHHGDGGEGGGGGGGPLDMTDDNIFWWTYEKGEYFDDQQLEYTIVVFTEDGKIYTTDFFMLDKNN